MRSAFLAFGILATMSVPGFAAPITYTDVAIGSGTFKNINFTNASISVSFTGDTNNVTGSPGYYTTTAGTGYVSVAGIGTATLFGANAFVNNDFEGTAAAGIGTSDGSVLDTFSNDFRTYALGSIGATSGRPYINSGTTFATSSGDFEISSINGSSVFSTSTVPLPASAPMFGAALLALGAVGYSVKRMKAAAAA